MLIAHDLIAWTQRLLLADELARAEPKRLRYRLLHIAARLAFHARGARLRLQASWPWASDLAAASKRSPRRPADSPADPTRTTPHAAPSAHSHLPEDGASTAAASFAPDDALNRARPNRSHHNKTPRDARHSHHAA